MWLLSTLNMTSAAVDQKFKQYLILIYLNIYCHLWLMATVWTV